MRLQRRCDKQLRRQPPPPPPPRPTTCHRWCRWPAPPTVRVCAMFASPRRWCCPPCTASQCSSWLYGVTLWTAEDDDLPPLAPLNKPVAAAVPPAVAAVPAAAKPTAGSQHERQTCWCRLPLSSVFVSSCCAVGAAAKPAASASASSSAGSGAVGQQVCGACIVHGVYVCPLVTGSCSANPQRFLPPPPHPRATARDRALPWTRACRTCKRCSLAARRLWRRSNDGTRPKVPTVLAYVVDSLLEGCHFMSRVCRVIARFGCGCLRALAEVLSTACALGLAPFITSAASLVSAEDLLRADVMGLTPLMIACATVPTRAYDAAAAVLQLLGVPAPLLAKGVCVFTVWVSTKVWTHRCGCKCRCNCRCRHRCPVC